MIRTVDGHNSALLRAQAMAARDVRVGRGESSRSGASRLFGGAMRSVGRERESRGSDRERESRRHGRDAEEVDERWRRDGTLRRSARDEEDEINERKRNHERRDRGRSRRSYRDEEEEVNGRRRNDGRSELSRRERRERDRRSRRDQGGRPQEESDEDSRHRRTHQSEQDGKTNGADDEEEHRSKHTNRHTKPSRSPLPVASSPPVKPSPLPPSPTLPPALALSKMDKYFNREYDPRFDLGEVPKEGFIGEVGWHNMLAILKERGKKRRHHSPTLSDDPLDIPAATAIRASSPSRMDNVKPRRKEKKMRWSDESDDERERGKRKEKKKQEKQREKNLTTTVNGDGDGKGMFDMAYVKKGGVREWDVGK